MRLRHAILPNSAMPMPRLDKISPDCDDYWFLCAKELEQHRPEVLETRRGRWIGPLVHDRIAGLAFMGQKGSLRVIVSPWGGEDGPFYWFHLSVSHASRIPDYEDLTECRKRFFRPSDTVLHVWPPADEHYNEHPRCLHLWTPMDGSRPIPDLRADDGGV